MLAHILAASDAPTGRSILFGAVLIAIAAVVIGGLWKLFGYAMGAAIGKALRRELGGDFAGINQRLDHLHDCLERRLGAVEARESSALLVEVRRLADFFARTSSPRRATDAPSEHHLSDRALPPSETT